MLIELGEAYAAYRALPAVALWFILVTQLAFWSNLAAWSWFAWRLHARWP